MSDSQHSVFVSSASPSWGTQLKAPSIYEDPLPRSRPCLTPALTPASSLTPTPRTCTLTLTSPSPPPPPRLSCPLTPYRNYHTRHRGEEHNLQCSAAASCLAQLPKHVCPSTVSTFPPQASIGEARRGQVTLHGASPPAGGQLTGGELIYELPGRGGLDGRAGPPAGALMDGPARALS